MKGAITLIVISGILLFLSSCIFFQNVNQPSKSAPNQIITVTIIANTQGGSNEPYFGVCLPIGWIVPGDSVQCGGAYEEAIHYDTLITSWQESASHAPSGYYWWAGKGIPDETAVGNVFANLKIQTDNQLGVFSIDYMLGDGYNGVNYERSNDHLIEITNDPLILFVNPEKGYQNFSLDMNILGLNTHFSDGTGTDNVWLSKNSNEISANGFVVNSNTSIDANFSIPLTTPIGLWDVKVETDIDGIVTKTEGFNVLPSPPLIVVSPDSLVVGVLPGSTRTKTITIVNEGEGDLYFDIVGGFSSTNYALQFDGITSFVELTNANQLGLTNNTFTVEAWINVSLYDVGSETVVGTTEGTNGLHFQIRDQKPYFGFYANDLQGNTIIETDTWYNIAWRYTLNSGEQAMFVNGKLDTSEVNHPPYIQTFMVNLGKWGGDFFNGTIDEVRIWNYARTQTEIQSDMQKQLTGLEPGLISYWQLNEGIGNITLDKTANAHNGTLFGDVTWTNSSAPILPGWFQVNTDSGFCSPHTSMDVELLFDATEVDTGDYYASVIVKSNDPFTPSVVVPIHMIVSSSVGIEGELNMPLTFNLYQNYPNPFNPSTTIKYSIPELSKVRLTLFNLLGEEITTLVNEEKNAGNYSVEFNASALPSGVYFYRIQAGSFVETKKMLLLK